MSKDLSRAVLDNLPGRMTFRMISTADSNVAMGGNEARKLPAIKGRAVWTNGCKHIEVQAPFVDNDLVVEIVETIKSEFQSGKRKNYQPILETAKKSNAKEFVRETNQIK